MRNGRRRLRPVLGPLSSALPAAALVLALALPIAPTAAAKGGAKCKSFSNQASAQDFFFSRGGSPDTRVGALDPDGNGVACEKLGGPFKGYLEVEVESRRHFLYGIAAVPKGPAGQGAYPCLLGKQPNLYLTRGAPRKVSLYKQAAGKDPLIATKGSLPDPKSGTMEWKLDARSSGRFYVEVTPAPEDEAECPAFRSRTVKIGGG